MKTILLSLLLVAPFARAGEAVAYKAGSTTLEGYLAMPETKRLNNPAVLIIHDWMGLRDQTKQKADQLAKMGYVALAVDMYGKGVHPKDAKEAGANAGKVKGDVKMMRQRIRAALEVLKKQGKRVDPSKIVAFGYCFGGTVALELARDGAPVAGVASFHGGLSTPNPADAKNIKGRVLVMHGAIDPNVPPAEVQAFQKEMNDAKVDYVFVAYANAVHAFTEPSAGSDVTKGVAYNEKADRRSWAEFERFLSETAPL